MPSGKKFRRGRKCARSAVWSDNIQGGKAGVMNGNYSGLISSIDEFYMKTGPVHQTLARLTQRLGAQRIDYAVIGGMALVAHGFIRPTEDIDVLLTPEGLDRFRSEFAGRGYRPAFEGAMKSFVDTITGVRIEFITQGEYPGDGKPKPVVFPNPADVAFETDGISVIELRALVELKLASGLSAPHRLQDLADVQQLVAKLDLPRSLGESLDTSVRPEFERLWDTVEQARRSGLERDR